MQHSPHWLTALALCGCLGSGPALAAGPAIRLGDGLGTVRAYDVGLSTVQVNGSVVPLLPQAAVSLQRQLAQQGWKPGTPFSARYNVVADSGRRAIDSIHVYPPRTR